MAEAFMVRRRYQPTYRAYQFRQIIGEGDLEQFGCSMGGSYDSYLFYMGEMIGRPFVGDWLVVSNNGSVRLLHNNEFEKEFEIERHEA